MLSILGFLDLRATPGAFKLTPGALKDLFQHLELFFVQPVGFFALLLLAPLFQLNDVCHANPPFFD
jgi:hypothetical protein